MNLKFQPASTNNVKLKRYFSVLLTEPNLAFGMQNINQVRDQACHIISCHHLSPCNSGENFNFIPFVDYKTYGEVYATIYAHDIRKKPKYETFNSLWLKWHLGNYKLRYFSKFCTCESKKKKN